jgi:hypothetical protein
MSDNLYYFKSFSGEWIIGELVEDNEDHFILSKPRVVVYGTTEKQGEYVTHYVPYDITNPDGNMGFHPDYVAAQVISINQQIVDGYRRATTGLEIAHSIN